MSETKFSKAVKIVQTLPKDGPIQPTQDDQLYVRTPGSF
jgi:diazepam-binding inhibitor (GABA receptor modulating acyl-CoA-binding protein)